MLLLALLLLLGALSSYSYSLRLDGLAQPEDLLVTNVDTGLRYSRIQEAINAPQTLNGHTILVGVGVFKEQVVVNKTVSLIGDNRDQSIIDGMTGTIVIHVKANRAQVKNLSIRNGTFGIWLDYSNNSRIIGNKLTDGTYGIRLYHSRNTLVTGNDVSGYRYYGIELDQSGNNTLQGNSMSDNRYNFGVDGRAYEDFMNDIDASNTVNGEPIRYLTNQHNVVIDASTFTGIGYLGIVNSSNILVENLNVQKNIQGILLAFTPNSSIRNVVAHENWNGVYVAYSKNVSVSGVKANSNFDYGIKYFNSSLAKVTENDCNNNGWAGIGLFRSHNSRMELNEASNGTYDLHIVFTNNSVITRNTAHIKPGSYSIALYYSHNNLIYHNDLVNSLLYVETRGSIRFTPPNTWDNNGEGNYWLYYGGRDIDQDGIGDTPLNIGENNVDHYPLMGLYSEFSITLNGQAYSVGVVSNSTLSDLKLDVESKKITFSAVGQNGTLGFSRVAIPNSLANELGNGLVFSVNGKEPVWQKNWNNEAYTYWYLSFVNIPPQPTFDPWIIVIGATLILVIVCLFLIQRRRPHKAKQSAEEPTQQQPA